MNTKETNLKQKVVNEMRLFLIYSLILTLFLWALRAYQSLILGEYSISYVHYGYAFVEALILSKIILLGQNLQMGERFSEKPLIFITLYKTVIFCLYVLVFTVLEHFVVGFLHGNTFEKVYQELLSKGKDEILAKMLVMFCFFVIFFAFLETGRVLGTDRLVDLFIRKR